MESSRWFKPNLEVALCCPRCASSNTKFCYFNNYSFSQPRYFCKSCRRYWTKDGSLRKVPVGGSSRKTRRPKPSRHSHPTARVSIGTISCSHDRGDSNRESCGSDIDMALLFARFFNQNTSPHHQPNGSSSSDLSNSMTSERVEARNDDTRRPSDPIRDWEHEPIEGLLQEESIQNILGQELGGIELEGLLGGDEMVQDVFWSDATTSSSLAWQPPMMAFQQELECSMLMPFNEDDQFPIASTLNLTSDGWNWSA